MDSEKLIETLRQHGVSCVRAYGRYCSICDEAADALSTLQAENENLRAELERVKAERDAAVKDLNEFLSMDELCPIQCEWCKWNGTYCDGKTPEWRSVQNE